MRSLPDKTPKEGGRRSSGARKNRMVLAAFVPESPAHWHKLQGFCDYAAKAGWNVWSLEREPDVPRSIRPSSDNPRKRVVLEALRRNEASRPSQGEFSPAFRTRREPVATRWPL